MLPRLKRYITSVSVSAGEDGREGLMGGGLDPDLSADLEDLYLVLLEGEDMSGCPCVGITLE